MSRPVRRASDPPAQVLMRWQRYLWRSRTVDMVDPALWSDRAGAVPDLDVLPQHLALMAEWADDETEQWGEAIRGPLVRLSERDSLSL